MISKKLSAKKMFGRLLKQEFIRKIWVEGIVIIALLFTLPVKVALELGQYSKKLSDMPDSVLSDFMVQNEQLLVLVFLLSVFIALTEFGYLFQRSKVDFYHSLPVSRTMQFLYRYFSGLILFLIPYVILYGSAILVGIAHGALIIGYLKSLIIFLLTYLLFFCILYSLSVIAVELAGSYLSALVVLLILHFTGPIFCYLVKECQSTFYKTWLDTGTPFLFGRGSAITICQKLLEDYRWTGLYNMRTLLILIAAALLLPVAAYVLFVKRPAEKTSCGLAYPTAGPFFRFLTVTGLGIMAGVILRSMAYSNADFWLFFGIVAACIVLHCLMQMILQMNFRAFFQGKCSLFLCVGSAVLIMCVFRYDLTGYDTYLPDMDQVDSVGVNIDDLEYYRNYIRECTEQEYNNLVNQDMLFNMVYDAAAESIALEQMNLKNIRPVLKMAAESIKKNDWEFYEKNMQVCFRLKNGKCIFRAYKIDLMENLEDCAEIFAMDRFKEDLYPILIRGEDNCTVWLNNNYSDTKQKLALSDTRYINLLRTYKRELKDLDLLTLTEEEPLLTLEFTESQNDCFNSYPVYPSFEHTLTLLKGYGYTFQPMTEVLYKVEAFYEKPAEKIDMYEDKKSLEASTIEEWDSEDSDSVSSLWIEDKKKLKELSSCLVADVYCNTNLTIRETEPGYTFVGYLRDPATGEEITMGFVIEKDKVPDFLKKLKENSENPS